MLNNEEIPFDMTPYIPYEGTAYYSETMQGPAMKEYVSLYNIQTSVNNCMLCPLNEYIKPLELSKGMETKHIMIIGDDPTDVLSQYANGAVLHELLSEFDFDKNYIHFTSLAKCVGATNFKDCHHHLISEVISIEPKIIIALGYNAAYPFMSHIAEANGQQLVPGVGYSLENGSDMIVVNRPIDTANNIQLKMELKSHMSLVFEHLRNKLTGGF